MMSSLPWIQTFVGQRIIVSELAVERKVKYRAVAVVIDVRRPNRVKPIYKQKRFETVKPIAYKVDGVGLIIHPDLYRKLQEQVKGSFVEQERKLSSVLFGVNP